MSKTEVRVGSVLRIEGELFLVVTVIRSGGHEGYLMATLNIEEVAALIDKLDEAYERMATA